LMGDSPHLRRIHAPPSYGIDEELIMVEGPREIRGHGEGLKVRAT